MLENVDLEPFPDLPLDIARRILEEAATDHDDASRRDAMRRVVSK